MTTATVSYIFIQNVVNVYYWSKSSYEIPRHLMENSFEEAISRRIGMIARPVLAELCDFMGRKSIRNSLISE